ncbi:immunity 49 family protein [Streptomyces sp. SID11385]|uniref:immunity 49 family protein n=1 Tax=Streptomyces sp. SID11385 TaxID=2706031 RepID=UPI0013C9D38E|nr:immunity 49 family protein [Streptomyces sp. SID11385]NEA38300.1 immunity 49 family protein [Streptomyces sp. SID11385]
MTVTVDRHGVLGPYAAEAASRLERTVAEGVDSLEQSPEMIDMDFRTSLSLVRARLAIDPEASELPTWEAVTTALQLGSLYFRLGMPGAVGPVVERVARVERTVPLPAEDQRRQPNFRYWLNAFYLAVVCRDGPRAEALCEVPVALMREAPFRFDEYLPNWVGALQAYCVGRPDLGERLTAAIQLSHPSVLRVVDGDTMNKVLYPPINLFYLFLRDKREEFGPALVDALKLHKSFWSADEDMVNDASGFSSLPLLAMACLARDAGFPIDVESPYIPHFLLSGEWVGEFPT